MSTAAATRAGRDDAQGRRLVLVGAVLLAVLLALAFLTTRGGDDDASPDTTGVAVGGEALPRFDAEAAVDPAVGMLVPSTAGIALDGTTVNPTRNGEAKAIVFLAHWCPVCQREVPLVQAWLDGGGLPDGVGLYAVSTAVTPSRDNHPPAAWLEREGWTPPTLQDAATEAADAYGLSAYPFWVFVDDDDRVVARHAGALAVGDLEARLAALGG